MNTTEAVSRPLASLILAITLASQIGYAPAPGDAAHSRYALDTPRENTVDVVHAGERLVVSIGSASWGGVAQADRPLITILDGVVTLPVIN